MFDINFYIKFDNVMKEIKNNSITDYDAIYNKLESIRSKNPMIFNIETTNRCNMHCKMCPRTKLMTRNIEDISEETFKKVAAQLHPHKIEDWISWKYYCEEKYDIKETDPPSENHFFLYVISDVIQLHGFGEPVLDKNMPNYIKILRARGLKTYFSTNPININLEETKKMLDNGLSYIKYCFDSIDDEETKEIRGNESDFKKSFEKVLQVIEYKKKHNLSTIIVITMINLNLKNQNNEYLRLKKLFEKEDVYLYLKSENSQWYRKNYHGTKSIHGSEVCKHPWMSTTIKSNGEVTMCMDDYNNEIVLGDANRETLEDIWNGEKYINFRKSHISASNDKCNLRCDLKILNDIE